MVACLSTPCGRLSDEARVGGVEYQRAGYGPVKTFALSVVVVVVILVAWEVLGSVSYEDIAVVVGR